MRVSVSIAIFASCIGVAAAAQKPEPSTKGGDEAEVTHINFEGSALDIAWTREHNVSEKTLELSSERAWSAYPAAFADLGLDPNIIDTRQMVFGSDGTHRYKLGKKRLSHFFECGNMLGVATADSYEVWVRLVSQIVPIDGSLSTVRTEVDAVARIGDRQGETVRCTSSGALESRLAALLAEEAAKLEE
ncbi:MAG: hypothetical protein ABI889_01195 [Gemmatimonadota bacterium]